MVACILNEWLHNVIKKEQAHCNAVLNGICRIKHILFVHNRADIIACTQDLEFMSTCAVFGTTQLCDIITSCNLASMCITMCKSFLVPLTILHDYKCNLRQLSLTNLTSLTRKNVLNLFFLLGLCL